MKKVLLVLIMFLSVCYSQAQTKNIGGYMPVAPNVESYLLPEVFTSDCKANLYFYNGIIHDPRSYFENNMSYELARPDGLIDTCFWVGLDVPRRAMYAQMYSTDTTITIKGMSAFAHYYFGCQEEVGVSNDFLLHHNNAKVYYEIMDSTLTNILARIDVTELLYDSVGVYKDDSIFDITISAVDTSINFREAFFEHPLTISGKFYAVISIFQEELVREDALRCYNYAIAMVSNGNTSCYEESVKIYINNAWSLYYGIYPLFLFPILGEGETVGVDEVDNSTDISIYPNPAKNDIFVTSGEKINQIELYNIKGEKMKTFYVDLFETNIDISSLEQGTYMLKVYTDKVVETKKIVKE